MEITGKLIQKLPVQSGTGVNGNWSRADILIETIEQYARKVCISFWGDRAHMLDQFQEGSVVTVSFDLESRESRNTPGSWFTSVRAWKIEPATPAAVTGAPAARLCPPRLCPTAAADVSAPRLSSTTGLCPTATRIRPAATTNLSAATARVCAGSTTGLSGSTADFFFCPAAARYEYAAQYPSGDVHRRGRRG